MNSVFLRLQESLTAAVYYFQCETDRRRFGSGIVPLCAGGSKVRNLTVTGEVSPSGSQDQVGGIVGVNYGSIENCKFTGNVVGDTDVGGIAGSMP